MASDKPELPPGWTWRECSDGPLPCGPIVHGVEVYAGSAEQAWGMWEPLSGQTRAEYEHLLACKRTMDRLQSMVAARLLGPVCDRDDWTREDDWMCEHAVGLADAPGDEPEIARGHGKTIVEAVADALGETSGEPEPARPDLWPLDIAINWVAEMGVRSAVHIDFSMETKRNILDILRNVRAQAAAGRLRQEHATDRRSEGSE